jgi:REP element-mobilizing transposase RayT
VVKPQETNKKPFRSERTAQNIMSSTHLSLHYHIVFSTKERRAIIGDEWRGRLHGFLGGSIKTLDGVAEAVGGTRDHIHLLIGLRATHRLADVVKDIKTASSRWIHTEIGSKLFAWQTGYGAFTVSVSGIEKVKNYILNQEEHHRQKSFQDEYVELLKLSRIAYEEKYLW